MTTKDMTEADAYGWHSRTIVGSDGEEIGKVGELYLDDRTENPGWATVASGPSGGKSHFIPLAGASPDGDMIRARVTLSQVKDAPSVDPDGHLSEQQEAQLFEHYGISGRPVLDTASAALKRSSRTPIAQHPKPTGSRDDK
jgi:hypothetical protein